MPYLVCSEGHHVASGMLNRWTLQPGITDVKSQVQAMAPFVTSTLGKKVTMIFPDFALRHRGDGRRWLLEIVGFWTREYVERKLARLRAAELPNLVLCLDESRNCADAAVPPSSRLIRFHRWIDAAAVLRVIE